MSVLDTDFPWNPEQEEIIEHREGPLQVIACAGSGKTSTVSARIAELVHDGVDRDSILAFTFTENAAEELKVRVRDWMNKADLEEDHIGEMYIDTIHAFCQDLLNEHRPNTLSYDVLSETELAAFISQQYWEIGLDALPPRHPEARYEKIEWFKDDLDTIRRELQVEELRDSDEDYAPQLCDCYDNFRSLMDEFHFFDYQELIYRAVQLLDNNIDVLEQVQDQYEYIIVDEYQDVNPAQERLVQLLAGDNRNLCVVGDDDQSIYNWRGARPEQFRNFAGQYGANQETLSENFRSTDLIVDLSQELISNNTDRINKPMETDRTHDVGDVYQHYFDNEPDEIGWIADRIEELVGVVYDDPKGNEKTLRYGDIGVLFRRRSDIENIQNELEERGIPYTIRGPNNIFDHPVAGFVRLALAYVARGQEDDPDARYDSVEIIDADQSDPRDSDDITRFSVTEQDLRQAIQTSRHLQDREDEIIEKLNDIQDWYRNPSSRRIEPQSELHKILNAMGISEAPEGDDLGADAFPEPVMYNIGKISELIQDFETVYEIIFPDQIRELVDFLDYSYFFSNPKVDDPTRINAVELMTVHSSKGMEFPAVFMPNLTSLKFSDTPNAPRSFRRHQEWIPQDVFDYDQYQDGPEELRRLFYVGMTRAQKFLHLTGSENNIGYKYNQNPSPFFEEVDEVNHSDVMTEILPDPTPREYREIDAGPREYNFPTSFTDLRYYRKCPYDYKLRKIYQFAPPIDQAFGFGFAVHDLLREMHERHDVENRDQLVMSPGEIRSRTQDKDRFHLRYASGEIEENLRESAAEMLIEYSQQYQDDLTSAYKSEIPFELLLSGDDDDRTALVTGEIDLLERRDPDTDELVEVDVIDFKTSDEPEDDNQKLLDHRFQVRLYGLATQKELDPEGANGYIHYLTENTRNEIDLSDEKVDQVESWVTGMVDGIMSREFYATPEPEICNGCDFKDICPHAETN
jgi:DNA helicase-2/ATP-dependent DNA helicase PcrA